MGNPGRNGQERVIRYTERESPSPRERGFADFLPKTLSTDLTDLAESAGPCRFLTVHGRPYQNCVPTLQIPLDLSDDLSVCGPAPNDYRFLTDNSRARCGLSAQQRGDDHHRRMPQRISTYVYGLAASVLPTGDTRAECLPGCGCVLT